MTAINSPEEQPHATCYATTASLRANFNQALRDRDARATADEHIGQAIRRLVQPGQKRRTIRISELRDLVALIDLQPQPTDTRDLTNAALRDQVTTLQAETVRLEHLLDQARRLPRPTDTPA